MGVVSDLMNAYAELATSAGAAVTPKYTDVLVGPPVPRGRCVRIWWAGEAIPYPQSDGKRYSLSSEMVGHNVVATVFEPLAGADENVIAQVLGTMADFVHELRTGFNQDRALGGKAPNGAELEAADATFATIGGAFYAFASCLLATGMTEYAIGGS